MTKTTLWAIIGVVVIGGGVYFATKNKGAEIGDVKNEGDSAQVATDASSSDARYKSEFKENTSLLSILNAGGSYQCTFAIDVANSKSTGTVYIANKKMAGDFESVVPQVNMTIKSHMVSDGDYMYTWSDMMPQGVKIKIDPNATNVKTPEASGASSFDYNQNLDYDCKAWSADTSKFIPPANITFKALN
jgi:hypothetical protein